MNTKGFTLVQLVAGLLILFTVIGWVKSVYNFTQCDFEPSYKSEVINGVGIVFAPIGAVTGWMDFGK